MTFTGPRVGIVALVAALVTACNLGEPPSTHPGASRAIGITDLDGDGAPEVVAAGSFEEILLVNDGAGGLAGAPAVIDREVQDLALGDVNADGALDRVELVTSTENGEAVRLAVGDGTGSFGPSTPVDLSIFPRWEINDVELADVDEDGSDDLVWAGTYGAHVNFSDGSGAFPVREAVGEVCRGTPLDPVYESVGQQVHVADVEADDDLDVLWSGECQYPGELRWVRGVGFNAGGGEFNRFALAHGGPGPRSELSVVDVNGDGEVDRIFAQRNAAVGEVVLGDAAEPGPTPPPTIVTVPMPGWVIAGEADDIDGDGHVDLVVATAGSGVVTVMYGDGTGSFPEHHALATGATGVETVAIGDLDANGRPDVVAGVDNDGEGATPSVVVFRNRLDGRSH